MTDIALKCSCGNVQGLASNIGINAGEKASMGGGIRLTCYCNYCQAFQKYLNKQAPALDKYGGTDAYFLSPSQITFSQGADQLACVRLSKRGPYRWFTQCCKTPIGNSLTPGFPFFTMTHSLMQHKESRDAELGPVQAHIYGNYANNLPAELNQKVPPLSFIVGFVSKMIIWKIKGMNKPNPFFDDSGKIKSEPEKPPKGFLV